MEHLVTTKDKRKFIRSLGQGLILIFVIGLLVSILLDFNEYQHYNVSTIDHNEDKGFIALSYFGVDREGTDKLISVTRLEEHFQALKKNGYITLRQEDIENYYKKDEKVPQRSMFIMFEDGRRDTAIFAEPILEKYNYIGTILSYGNKFERKDPKFLSPEDLKKLEKSTFFQLGTNGYRLSYINVFDRYNNFLGELDAEEFSVLGKHVDRNYNHYLMDFIRDENKIPKESYNQMKNRIKADYELMEDIYTEKLGKLPGLYVLMHSNTGQFASNKNVSGVNEEAIKKYFLMNFNREGFSHNHKEVDIFDLTRMQPQPYWYPNHLLMRIKADTKEDILFVDGDLDIKKDWEIVRGAAEFRKSSIIVTSEPESKGLIGLKKQINCRNLSLHTRLRGNVVGTQTIYLSGDQDLKEYISVKIKNNHLYIEEDGQEVFVLDLNEHDQIVFQSIDENRMEALKEEYKVYNKNIKRLRNPTRMEPQEQVEDQDVKSVADGAEEYIPEFQIHHLGNRKVDIYLKDNKLSVNIDNKEAVKDLPLSVRESAYIYLESAWGEYGYSQRNIADDVYDGVFEDIVIRDIDKDNEVIYMNKLQGKELVLAGIKRRWNSIVNWFISNL